MMQEVIELYFQDSAAKLDRLSAKLAGSRPDYSEVDALVHQFKGSSASFGAQTITQHCVQVQPPVLDDILFWPIFILVTFQRPKNASVSFLCKSSCAASDLVLKWIKIWSEGMTDSKVHGLFTNAIKAAPRS